MCSESEEPAPPPQSSYQYLEALPEGCIRLLKCKDKFTRERSIITVELSRAPQYTAVSYMWGQAERNSKILIDKYTFSITASAKYCLDVLSNRYLWIDSICINQSDDDEKNHQVKLMGEIYHHAYRVVGVLGEGTYSPGLEFQIALALPPISTVLTELGRMLDEGRSSVQGFMLETGMSEEELQHYKESNWRSRLENLKCHEKVVKILCYPYWRRVWIIQELAFAENVAIYYEGEYLNWSKLIHMFNDQSKKEHRFLGLEKRLYLEYISQGEIRDAYRRGSRLLEMIDRTRRITKRPLKDVLIDTIDSLATDPRDKIFGILNLVSNKFITEADNNGVVANTELVKLDPWFGNPSILPDYGKPYEKVWTETTLAIIMAGDGNTHLLAGGIGWSRGGRNMPSWVVDWPHLPQIHSNISSNTRLDLLRKRVWTRAAGIDIGDTAFVPLDRKRIMGKSITSDKIVFLSPRVKVDGPGWLHGCWEAICQVLPEKYAWKDSVLSPSITRIEALWRVLLDVDEIRPKHSCTTGPCDVPTDVFPQDFVWSNSETHLCKDLVARAFHAWASLETISDWYTNKLRKAFQAALLRCQSPGCRLAVTKEVTKEGFLGTVPPYSHLGDEIAIFPDCPTPVVLREVPEQASDLELPHTCRQLVGKSHFLGLMRAEWDEYSAKSSKEGRDWLKSRMKTVVLV